MLRELVMADWVQVSRHLRALMMRAVSAPCASAARGSRSSRIASEARALREREEFAARASLDGSARQLASRARAWLADSSLCALRAQNKNF